MKKNCIQRIWSSTFRIKAVPSTKNGDWNIKITPNEKNGGNWLLWLNKEYILFSIILNDQNASEFHHQWKLLKVLRIVAPRRTWQCVEIFKRFLYLTPLGSVTGLLKAWTPPTYSLRYFTFFIPWCIYYSTVFPKTKT